MLWSSFWHMLDSMLINRRGYKVMWLFVRVWLIGLCGFVGIIGLVQAMSYDAAYFDTVRDVFVASDCEIGTSCFLGVYPNQQVYAARDHLVAHPHVDAINIVDVQMRLHHIDITWNGAQPDFLQQPGYIVLDHEIVEAIILQPETSIGEIWHALGAPQAVNGNYANILLRYPDAGFTVRVRNNCDHFWQSDVSIEYDAYAALGSTDERTIIDILRESC